jgi:hypothetical protein
MHTTDKLFKTSSVVKETILHALYSEPVLDAVPRSNI